MPNRLDDLDREADQLLAEVGNVAAEVTRAKAGRTSHTQAAKPNGADEERESDKPITTAFDEHRPATRSRPRMRHRPTHATTWRRATVST